MSTNFYFHPEPDVCGECGHDKAHEPLHIGKTSGGWVFLWRGYEEPWLRLPTHWVQYLHTTPGVIQDEYGHEYSLGDFLIMVMLAQPNPNKHSLLPSGDAVSVFETFDVRFGEFA